MKRLLIALLLCSAQAFAGPTIRVSIHAGGDAAGVVTQAYRACLRDTPGVALVPEGQSTDALIQLSCVQTANVAGYRTGYAWAQEVVSAHRLLIQYHAIVRIGAAHYRGSFATLFFGDQQTAHRCFSRSPG